MSPGERRLRRRAPQRRAVLALALAGAVLSGCSELETEEPTGYEPATVKSITRDGSLKQVTFTREGAKRAGLRTATVRRSGKDTAVPYSALIYEPDGTTRVYTSPSPLHYVRAQVRVARISGDTAFLTAGPPAGSAVVTVGATQVYGAELEIAGGD